MMKSLHGGNMRDLASCGISVISDLVPTDLSDGEARDVAIAFGVDVGKFESENLRKRQHVISFLHTNGLERALPLILSAITLDTKHSSELMESLLFRLGFGRPLLVREFDELMAASAHVLSEDFITALFDSGVNRIRLRQQQRIERAAILNSKTLPEISALVKYLLGSRIDLALHDLPLNRAFQKLQRWIRKLEFDSGTHLGSCLKPARVGREK